MSTTFTFDPAAAPAFSKPTTLSTSERTAAEQYSSRDAEPSSFPLPNTPEVEDLLRLHGEGTIDVEPAQLPTLPDNATTAMTKVAEFFALVLALRHFADMEEADEVPFAVDWVAQKCGLPGMTVSRALRKLHDANIIVWTGRTMTMPKTRLWVMGDGTDSPAPAFEEVEEVNEPERIEMPTVRELVDRAVQIAKDGSTSGGSGARNSAGLWLACQLRDHFLPIDAAQVTMIAFVNAMPPGHHPYTEREALRSLEQAYRRAPREPWSAAVSTRSTGGDHDDVR